MPALSAQRLRRSHSWPPFRLPHAFTHHQNRDINEDPFSFFISEQDDDESFIFDYMNADIEVAPRPRSLSPFNRRKRQRSSAAATNAISMLKKWMRRIEPQYSSSRRSPEMQAERNISPELLPQPFPVSPTHRGRKNLRRSTKDIGANRQVRSHSGRPRIWQEPSLDIWTVTEEQEDLGLGLSHDVPPIRV